MAQRRVKDPDRPVPTYTRSRYGSRIRFTTYLNETQAKEVDEACAELEMGISEFLSAAVDMALKAIKQRR